MGAHETRTFKSGNSEAVRLPKDMAFGVGTAVRIEREPGGRITLTPVVAENPGEVRRQLQRLFDEMDAIGRPGTVQDRESVRFEFPDRPGL